MYYDKLINNLLLSELAHFNKELIKYRIKCTKGTYIKSSIYLKLFKQQNI